MCLKSPSDQSTKWLATVEPVGDADDIDVLERNRGSMYRQFAQHCELPDRDHYHCQPLHYRRAHRTHNSMVLFPSHMWKRITDKLRATRNKRAGIVEWR